MESDIDIQFGELEEVQPDPRLRPDRNKQFAVVAYESPLEEELPIFVDMDVMRDMEIHAQTDTSVELGGVLLGGQYEDQDGKPFVIITDSLRAQHYEATKGSFKFTHDTWEEITRQRDDFPDDLQMVGWYHTHPDWGVFLSGMDMFICDNFFNKPLDVALVIDPCRGDRGMFQWTGNPSERVRRTGGFYLTASRFRQQELEIFAAQLEGKSIMTNDPRLGGYSSPTINIPAPVVNVPQQNNQWQGLAVMGMMTMQFLVVALIAWKLLLPAVAAETDEEKSEQQVAQLEKKIDRLIEARRTESLIDAKLEVLDRVIRGEDGKPGAVNLLVDKQKQLNVLAEDLSSYRAAGKQHVAEIKQRERELAKSERDEKKERESHKKTKKELLETKIALREAHEKKAENDKKKTDDDSENGSNIWMYVSFGLIGVLLVGGVAVGVALRRDDDDREENEQTEIPASADVIEEDTTDHPDEEAR